MSPPQPQLLRAVLVVVLTLVQQPARAAGNPDPPALDTGSSRTIRALAFAPDGRTLVAGGDAGEVLAFEPDSGKRRWTYTAPGLVRALAVSPDGRRVAVGWAGTSLDLVDLATGKRVGRLGPLPGLPSHLVFSPKGDRLAVAGQFQQALLFDPTTGRRVALLAGPISWINAVAFSPDGQRLAAAGWDHGVRVWDLATGKLERSYFEHRFAVNGIAFTRDGAYVLSSSDDQSLVLFKLEGYLYRRSRGPSLGPLGQSRSTEVMVGGTWNGRVVFFREMGLAPIKIWPAHRGPVHAVALAPSGRVAASGGADGKVKLWKVP